MDASKEEKFEIITPAKSSCTTGSEEIEALAKGMASPGTYIPGVTPFPRPPRRSRHFLTLAQKIEVRINLL